MTTIQKTYDYVNGILNESPKHAKSHYKDRTCSLQEWTSVFLLMTDGFSCFFLSLFLSVVEGGGLPLEFTRRVSCDRVLTSSESVVACYHGKALMVPASIAFRVKQLLLSVNGMYKKVSDN